MNLKGPLITLFLLVIVILAMNASYQKKLRRPHKKALAPPEAAQVSPRNLWIPSNYFSQRDDKKFQYLNSEQHPEGVYCVNVGKPELLADDEHRQVFLQILEAAKGFATEEECKASAQANPNIELCPPADPKFSFDYIKAVCVAVQCEPGQRPRSADTAGRYFYQVYTDERACNMAARAK